MKECIPILMILSLLSFANFGRAEVFYTEEQIKAEFYPSTMLVSHPIDISRDLLKEIKRATSTRLSTSDLKVWEVHQGGDLTGWLFTAEVLGKHENIQYALGIDAAGKVTRLEIMEYRETHGGEVSDGQWRAQFYSKSLSDQLKLGKGIDNLSGATLSCRHLTDGIHGLLIVHDRILKPARL